MSQHEAASRAAIENGMEEGHGDSAESAPLAFPQDAQMEMDHEPIRNNPSATAIRHYEDQMVPSITSSLFRVEDEETSLDLRNAAEDSRAEVPENVNVTEEPRENRAGQAVFQTIQSNNTLLQSPFAVGRRNSEDSTAESSSSSRGAVPVWSPSSTSYSDQFAGDDNAIGTSSSYLQRHPQSHQLMNWQRLS